MADKFKTVLSKLLKGLSLAVPEKNLIIAKADGNHKSEYKECIIFRFRIQNDLTLSK